MLLLRVFHGELSKCRMRGKALLQSGSKFDFLLYFFITCRIIRIFYLMNSMRYVGRHESFPARRLLPSLNAA
jgi:hypothetical protein